jgi:Asp/Glu/hydantoin racemase
MTRIWHQSITDLSLLPGYESLLLTHAANVLDPSISVDVHGLRQGTYPDGLHPIDNSRYRWIQHLTAVQIVKNCMQAEREGYDAVAISCFLDPGLEEARSMVDIPILSACETALATAATFGKRFSLLTIDDAMVPVLAELARRYGHTQHIASITALQPAVTERDLDAAFSGDKAKLDIVLDQIRGSIAKDTDIIIPAEGVLNSMLVRNGMSEIAGLPVLDSYGALLLSAEMYARLTKKTSLRMSRAGSHDRPPMEIARQLESVTIDVLQD